MKEHKCAYSKIDTKIITYKTKESVLEIDLDDGNTVRIEISFCPFCGAIVE